MYEVWRQTITATIYCIFKAEVVLDRCEKYVNESLKGTNQSAKWTRGRAAGKHE